MRDKDYFTLNKISALKFMGKVLVVRKPDRTIHVTPVGNKPYYESHNRYLPVDLRWSLEVMEEDKAPKEAIDLNFVSASTAKSRLKDAEKEIERLRSQLAERGASPDGAAMVLGEAHRAEVRKSQLSDSAAKKVK